MGVIVQILKKMVLKIKVGDKFTFEDGFDDDGLPILRKYTVLRENDGKFRFGARGADEFTADEKWIKKNMVNDENSNDEDDDYIVIGEQKAGFKLDDSYKKVLDDVFQSGFNKENKNIVKDPLFFNTGYKGVSFMINDKKYYLLYSKGKVGLEDQTMGKISLERGNKVIWQVKADYYKSSFGKTDVGKSGIDEAKKLFKEFVDDHYENLGKSNKKQRSFETEQANMIGTDTKQSFVKIGNPYIDAEVVNGEAVSGIPVFELENPKIIKQKLDDLISDRELMSGDFDTTEIDDAINFLKFYL